MSERAFVVSAPGRICLFGEHQDYLGLPVIAAAITRRIRAEAHLSQNGHLLHLDMPDIGEQMEIDPSREQQYAHSRDYLRAGVNVLRRQGARFTRGADVRITSNIPMRAGVSSSSALVIMWLRLLCEIADPPLTPSADMLARWGHQTEVLEFGEPGGMMDHFCAALGGVLYIDTIPPYRAVRLPVQLNGLVLADSLQPKATIEVLASRRKDVTEGIALLKEQMPHFDLHTTPLEEAEEALLRLPERNARRVRANLVNRDLTRRALQLFQSDSWSPQMLGDLLLAHHAQLRDGLEVSTPKIEKMLEAALRAGALGGKVNGSGGGGCLFVFAPGHEEEVVEALKSAGGDAWRVRVDTGVRVE
ncbi:MAG: galactokinase family protein [Armatimonadota bacterium]|nr:GHMP kinase [bacterium]MCS7309219.1 GHMP kinase [Armatimonadota bacterium]MDW8290311.1 galactokinase family protein [Armatimonadota bacterium]